MKEFYLIIDKDYRVQNTAQSLEDAEETCKVLMHGEDSTTELTILKSIETIKYRKDPWEIKKHEQLVF